LTRLPLADGLAFVIVIVMAAPLKVAEAIRLSPNQAPINEKRDIFWTISRARNYLGESALFNV
jgi:hypothetical protein